MEHFELEGRRAVLLGAGSPAGEAIADAYREAGAEVVGVDRVDQATEPFDVLAIARDAFQAQPIADVDDEALGKVMATNFGEVFAAVRAARGVIRKPGRIVIVTSVLGERGLANCTAYAAAQGAVHNFIRAAAQEFAPAGISVNGIALGWMDWMDDRIDPTDPEAARAVRFTILKRAGAADEIGALAVWLSGSGAGFVTGQIFTADGGLTAHL